MGKVRVACCKAATPGVVEAKMTSGMNATNSAAYLQIRSGSLALQRISIRTLRPSIQPNCCSVCRNTVRRACAAASSAAKLMSTPMRRI